MTLQEKDSCSPFFTQVYKVYFRMKQERVNSKVFAPERPRNADVSKVLVFSARINSTKYAALFIKKFLERLRSEQHSCCFFACFLVALGAVFLANLEHGEDELLWKNRCKYTFSPVFGSWMAEALRSNFT